MNDRNQMKPSTEPSESTEPQSVPNSDKAADAKANPPESPKDPDFMDPIALSFDLENPRFVDERFKDEIEIIEYLYDQADVDELIQSMICGIRRFRTLDCSAGNQCRI